MQAIYPALFQMVESTIWHTDVQKRRCYTLINDEICCHFVTTTFGGYICLPVECVYHAVNRFHSNAWIAQCSTNNPD